MTVDARFERDLVAVLEDLYLGPSPDYRHQAMELATHRRQRPAWTFPGRWLPMEDIAGTAPVVASVRWRTIGVAVVVIALIVAALAVVAGSQHPKVPPPFGLAHNGQIVYPTNGDVFALDPATGRTTALVTGDTGDLDALFSPDGTSIAFSRLSTGQTPVTLTIWVADAHGANPRAVTTQPLAADRLRFEWAPDSRSILVQTAEPEIWLLDATAAAEPRVLAARAELLPGSARPPDGKQLLIRRTQGFWHQLIVLNAASGEERVIAEGGGDAIRSARWSNDGQHIVYSTTVPGDRAAVRLWIVEADGTGAHPLTSGSGTWANEDPSWSPDDRLIAFTQWQQTSSDPAIWDIRPIGIVDVATGLSSSVGPIPRDVRATHPTSHDMDATAMERFAFDWSPDGRWLIAVPTAASGHPVLIDPTTGTYQVLDTIFDEQGGAAQLWQRTAP
jgi:Tol biopolymer transport system component